MDGAASALAASELMRVVKLRRKRQGRSSIALRHVGHEMLEQDRNLFLTLAQRRNVQRESVQPAVEIFAQPFIRKRFGNVDVEWWRAAPLGRTSPVAHGRKWSLV